MYTESMPCRRCLLIDLPDGKALRANIDEYRRLLPEAQRANEATYAARLSMCRQCDALMAGTCRLCGCYVEARAAKSAQRCPRVPPAWTECVAP